MKKFKLNKVISVILFIAVISTALSTVVSAYQNISVWYQNITILGAGLSINSSGLATCDGYVALSNSNTNTTLTVNLQKYSGGSWISQQTWTASGTGTGSITKSGQRYVTSGKYRVTVTAKIYSSSGTLIEEESCISSEVTY